MTRLPFPTPALDFWREELRRGKRTPTTFDPLWRAACAEMWALDMTEYPPIADGFRRDALKILEAELKQKQRPAS